MSGADFVKGAIGGYKLVDDAYDKRDRKIERKQAIATEEERYTQSVARQEAATATESERYAQGVERQEAATATESERYTQGVARQEAATATESERYKASSERQTRLDTEAETARTRDRLIQDSLAAGARAEAGVEDFPIELHRQLVEIGARQHSFFNGIENPEEHKATLAIMPLVDRLMSGDPEAFNDVNSPQNINLLNKIFADQINTNLGEVTNKEILGQTVRGKIVSKRIGGLYAGPKKGTFVAEITVTLDNGQEYTAPRTMNMTGDESDLVKEIDAGTALDDLVGRVQVARYLESKSGDITAMYRRQTTKQDPAIVYRDKYLEVYKEMAKVKDENDYPISAEEARRRTEETLAQAGIFNPTQAPVTATHPETGETIQLVNGQWVPYQ